MILEICDPVLGNRLTLVHEQYLEDLLDLGAAEVARAQAAILDPHHEGPSIEIEAIATPEFGASEIEAASGRDSPRSSLARRDPQATNGLPRGFFEGWFRIVETEIGPKGNERRWIDALKTRRCPDNDVAPDVIAALRFAREHDLDVAGLTLGAVPGG